MGNYKEDPRINPPLPPEEAAEVWAAGGTTTRWIVVRNADGSIAGTAIIQEGPPAKTPIEAIKEWAREQGDTNDR